jgi:hypothetical protein
MNFPFLRHTGVPQSLLDVLAFKQVFEPRVDQQFHQEPFEQCMWRIADLGSEEWKDAA